MDNHRNTERHLLFGLMALQNGLVTREQLVAAFSKWTVDKSSSLDQLLVADGALDVSAADALGALISLHVQRNNGSPQKTLMSLSGSGFSSAKDALLQLNDEELQKSIAAIPDSPEMETLASAVGEVTSTGGRFRILRPLPGAKGGMGVISVAQDEELGRQVALKQILADKADNAGYRQKFQVEAEITGNLEHPGIVPIYGLGVGPDGRPYYAMRLVHGDNLSAQIKNFHAALDRGELDYNSVDFHGLVDRLIDVAQAVSYAHSRGVLHRDLKPGNVLVGEYGETLVIDWGLARLPHDEPAASVSELSLDSKAPLSIRSGSNVDATMQGQVLGTVGYAPPEQLNGRVDLITERSDVYALGAILYQILLGRAPVTSKHGQLDEIIKDTIVGRITPPPRLRRAVPKSLSAVCMEALAREPSDRYASVDEFIAELERWKADQPVEAAPDSIVDRVARLARRYRSAALATTAALLGIALVTGAALFLVNRARINEKAARDQAEQLAAEKTELADRNQTVVDAFVAAFRSADPKNEGVTSKMTALEVLQQALAEIETDEALAKNELTKAELLDAIGQSLNSLGAVRESLPAYEETFRLRKAQLGPDHPETIESMNELAVAYDTSGRLQEALPLCEEALRRAKSALGDDDPVTLQSMFNLAGSYESLGRFDEAVPLYEEALRLTKAIHGENHYGTLATLNNLGYAYHSAGRLDDAVATFEEAFRKRKETLGDDHPDTLSSMVNLAACYDMANRLDEALSLLEQAIPLYKEKLGDDHPDTLTSVNNLAAAYQDAGRADDALQLLEQTYEITKAKLGVDHPKTLAYMDNVAYCYSDAGRIDEAIELKKESHRLHKAKFGDDHPETLESIHDLAMTYYAAGRLEEAAEQMEEACRLRRIHLGHDHPNTLLSTHNLAALYQSMGRAEKAIPLLEGTLELRRAKLEEDSPHTLTSMHSLARVYDSVGRSDEALGLFEEALRKQYATLGPAHRSTLTTRQGFQTALTKAKQYERAKTNAEEWLQALRGFEIPNPAMIARAQSALAEALLGIGDSAAAMQIINTALESKTLQGIYEDRARSIKGAALAAQAKFTEAEPLLVESAEAFASELEKLKPQSRWYVVWAHERVVSMYEAWGKTDQAEEWQRRLTSIQSKIDSTTTPSEE